MKIDRVKAIFDPSMKWQLVEEYGGQLTMSELPQPALRLGWGFLLRNGTPEGVPHYHHSVC